nr:MAG TPA: hypothetical protein [Caudoviricetes sp.]
MFICQFIILFSFIFRSAIGNITLLFFYDFRWILIAI